MLRLERNNMIADGNCQFLQLGGNQNLLNINNKFYKYFSIFKNFSFLLFVYKIIPHRKYTTVISV